MRRSHRYDFAPAFLAGGVADFAHQPERPLPAHVSAPRIEDRGNGWFTVFGGVCPVDRWGRESAERTLAAGQVV